PLRHRPGHQHPVALQPDVPVQPPGVVLLDHEHAAVRVLRGGGRLGRYGLRRPGGIALAPVRLQLVRVHVTLFTRITGAGTGSPARSDQTTWAVTCVSYIAQL